MVKRRKPKSKTKSKARRKVKPRILAAEEAIDHTPGVMILNENGSRTVMLLGGGEYPDLSPFMHPPDTQDYGDFVKALTDLGWRVIIPYGRRDLSDWYDKIINVYGTPKPDIIVGHSEGGFLAMQLAEDKPTTFSKYLIFNVPLMYPSSDGWKECYSKASNIKDNVTIFMSEQDRQIQPGNGIMGWSMNGFSMYDAIRAITALNLSNITITTLNLAGYEHSPFPSGTALSKFKEVTGSST